MASTSEFPKQPGHPMSQRSPVTGGNGDKRDCLVFLAGVSRSLPFNTAGQGQSENEDLQAPPCHLPRSSKVKIH